MELKVGDTVFKTVGSYTALGTVRAVFTTSTNATRVVFEFIDYPGMLHIFSPEQLEKRDASGT